MSNDDKKVELKEFKWMLLGILFAWFVQVLHELFLTNMTVSFNLTTSSVVTLLFWEGIALLVVISLYVRYVFKKN